MSETFTFYIQPWYRKSPYFESTKRAGCRSWGLYNHMLLPTLYDDPVTEYWALLNGVTMWDVAVERCVEISGPDALEFTNLLTCRDLTTCAVGQCKYVLLTDATGGIVNDPVLLRLAEDRFWLALADSDALLFAKGVAALAEMDVDIEEADVSPMQIQGPRSKDVIRGLFGDEIADLRYYWCAETEVNGIPVVVSRTGWTGEVGYEVYLRDASRGDELWRLAEEAGAPFDIRAIAPSEARRIEAGIFNYGSDMRTEDTPFHITGLERLVELDQSADFIGKDALTRIAHGGGRSQAGRHRHRRSSDDGRRSAQRSLARARAGEGTDRSRDGRGVVAAPRAQHRLRMGADVAYGGRNTPRARVERERPHRRGGGPSVRGSRQGDPESVSGSVPFDRAVEYYDRTRGMSEKATREMVGVLGAELAGRGRCLEVGVGTGLVALPLAEAGVPMVGVDLSAPMLGKLVEKAGGRAPFPLVVADATRLPLADDRFGGAVVRHVLHLVPEWRHVISELIRVVSSGGVVLESRGDIPVAWREATDRFKSLAGEPSFVRGLESWQPWHGGSSLPGAGSPSAFVAADHRTGGPIARDVPRPDGRRAPLLDVGGG